VLESIDNSSSVSISEISVSSTCASSAAPDEKKESSRQRQYSLKSKRHEKCTKPYKGKVSSVGARLSNVPADVTREHAHPERLSAKFLATDDVCSEDLGQLCGDHKSSNQAETGSADDQITRKNDIVGVPITETKNVMPQVVDTTADNLRPMPSDVEETQENDVFAAICETCFDTHIVAIDFMGLGMEFHCDTIGKKCEGPGILQTQGVSSSRSVSAPPVRSRKQQQELSAEEKKRMFEEHDTIRVEARTKPKDIHKGVQQVMEHQAERVRYVNNQVVSNKGERIIRVDPKRRAAYACAAPQT